MPILHSNCKITTSNTPSLALHIYLHFHSQHILRNTYILIIPTIQYLTQTHSLFQLSNIMGRLFTTYISYTDVLKDSMGVSNSNLLRFFHFIFQFYSTSSIHSIHTIITKHTLTTLTSIYPNHFIQLHLLITNTLLLLFKTYSFSDSTSTDTHSMHMTVFYSLSTFQIYNSNFDKCQIEFERSNLKVDLKPRMVFIDIRISLSVNWNRIITRHSVFYFYIYFYLSSSK